MNTKAFHYLATTTVLSVGILISSVEGQQRGRGRNGGGTNAGTLTQLEESALTTMTDDEKLAHDVYVTLSRKYKTQIFTNIAAAEARHMNALSQIALLGEKSLHSSAQAVPVNQRF
jgi:hypothetical protein